MTKSVKPYAGTRLADLIEKRILELRGIKSLAEIATEAGFTHPPMLSMIKSGATKLPLDRVPSMAKALGLDPALVLHLTLEQTTGSTTALAIMAIFGEVVSRNEVAWLHELRDASGHVDPPLTARSRLSLRAIFGR